MTGSSNLPLWSFEKPFVASWRFKPTGFTLSTNTLLQSNFNAGNFPVPRFWGRWALKFVNYLPWGTLYALAADARKGKYTSSFSITVRS
jgi:hypothetical protein